MCFSVFCYSVQVEALLGRRPTPRVLQNVQGIQFQNYLWIGTGLIHHTWRRQKLYKFRLQVIEWNTYWTPENVQIIVNNAERIGWNHLHAVNEDWTVLTRSTEKKIPKSKLDLKHSCFNFFVLNRVKRVWRFSTSVYTINQYTSSVARAPLKQSLATP
jgi:hypothetical protein